MRVNTISPGIIFTPLAKDELNGPRGEGYRRMIALSPVGRSGTPDEVGNVAALLMGPNGAFITGSDFLMDGGVTAMYWFGNLLRREEATFGLPVGRAFVARFACRLARSASDRLFGYPMLKG